MSREETIRLLQFLKGCYPNVRIDDPSGMVDAWMLVFSTDKAEDVYRGARYHMTSSKFFPTPADIRAGMFRASLLYDMTSAASLPEKRSEQKEEDENKMTDEEFLKFIGLDK